MRHKERNKYNKAGKGNKYTPLVEREKEREGEREREKDNKNN